MIWYDMSFFLKNWMFRFQTYLSFFDFVSIIMTVTSGQINLQSKCSLNCHVVKVKAATSVHFTADVMYTFLVVYLSPML